MIFWAIPTSGLATTYYVVNMPSANGACSISQWVGFATWGAGGASMVGGGADSMMANPGVTYVSGAHYNKALSNWPYWYNQTFPPSNATIVDVKVGVLGYSAWLNSGWLSWAYAPTQIPNANYPWLDGSGVPVPWHNSTFYPYVASPTATSHWWTVTTQAAFTVDMLMSDHFYVMWTQNQTGGSNQFNCLIDYVGVIWAWQTYAPYVNPDQQHNWTESPYNFGGWLSPGLFLGVIGVMGLLGMVATPFVYAANREHEDTLSAIALTIFQFTLFMGFFLAWIFLS